MEEQYRRSPLVWIGSILMTLLVVGALFFGAYRLYALGWANGAAASRTDEPVEESPRVPLVPAPGYRVSRFSRFPFIGLLITLFIVSAVFRHFTWPRHAGWMYWRGRPGPRGWVPHYPGYPAWNPEHPEREAAQSTAENEQ